MDSTLTLYELNSLVREVIETEMAREYWVEAELSEVRESRGHCYMELVQKEEFSNTPIAKASAKCWRSSWVMIQPHFERITGQRLHAGMKARLKVYAQFHEAFGFSWIVTDIDPNYTLGDMARRRQEIIAQLKKEGVFDLQKDLHLPLFCLNIAVISSESAAGYGDFCHQLADSGFSFHTQLFPAVMQGEQVEESIIQALERIYELQNHHHSQFSIPNSQFDCVVIIRGGGATSDMSGFDTLALAENVAQFPLPIITGIGHDRDECILDMVSHLRVKTPTAAAAFLIDHAQQVLDRIEDAENRLVHTTQLQFSNLKSRLSTLAIRIPTLFSLAKTRQETRLQQADIRLSAAINKQVEQARIKITLLQSRCATIAPQRLLNEQHRLALIEQRTESLDPQLLLKRGYSITLLNGKAVRKASELKKGDEIDTLFAQGTIKSVVK
jgi:exodeoxyribonuclease VII large subunit